MLRRIWSFSTLVVLFMCITASYKSSVLGNTSNPNESSLSNVSAIFWRASRRSKTSSTVIKVSKDVNKPVEASGIFLPTSLPVLTNSIKDSSSLDESLLLDGVIKTKHATNVESTVSSLTEEPSSEPSISIPTLTPNSNENIASLTRDNKNNKIVEESALKDDNEKKENLVPTPVASTERVSASQEARLEAKPQSTNVNATEEVKIVSKIHEDDSEKKNSTTNDSKISQPVVQEEDMPSFDEWKKKKLAEHTEGDKPIQTPSIPGKKVGTASSKRRRNYASSECGAKIVAANSESEGPNRILNEQMDAYMLNSCKAKIWFIIELCDSIHAAQFELANFELFSSLPRDFSLYWSDHFPTRDWTLLGNYIAPDQRGLHTFDLKQPGFGKFLKVELHSYYGREHYCPLSLVRVYGTSMVDEYEEMEIGGHLHPHISEADGDIMDAPAFQEGEDDSSKNLNLFGSARDAVLNIVRKAARALGREDLEGKIYTTTQSILDVGIIDEENSTTLGFNKTSHSLWKNTAGLGSLLDDCGLCVESEEDSPCFHSRKCLFFLSIFNISTIAQFCQTSACSLASLNYTNKTLTLTELKKVPIKFELMEPEEEALMKEKPLVSEENSTDPVIYLPPISEDTEVDSIETKIEEKIQVSEKILDNSHSTDPLPVLQSSLSDFSSQPVQPAGFASVISTPAMLLVQTETLVTIVTPEIEEMTDNIMLEEGTKEPAVKTDQFNPHLDITHQIPTRNLGVIIPTGQKESVFMRLSNRIKVLEMNMSLSSLYLQELSQRYRRQMEDMQRGFNRTVQTLNDTAQLAERRDKQQQEAIKDLQVIVMDLKKGVDQLTSERESFYRQVLEAHLFLLAVETIVVITIMTLCMRRMRYYNPNNQHNETYPDLDLENNREIAKNSSPLKRHNSTNDLMGALLPGKKRRPSEVVSYSGNYNELLIVEPAMPIFIEPGTKNKRKNRHRKAHRSLQRSLSNPILNEDKCERCSNCLGKPRSSSTGEVSMAGDLFGGVTKNCENCCFFVPSLPTILSPVKQQKMPLQNVTNGSVSFDEINCSGEAKSQSTKTTTSTSSPNKEHFSFKKLLKFRKNEAV